MMEKLLKCSCLAGKLLLESGAETYRVEDTMVRLCKAYGCEEVESFVLPTGLILSFEKDGQNYTKNIRVSERNTDLNRVDLINSLSRKANENHLTLDELYDELCKLKTREAYPFSHQLFFASIGAGGFALFFQSSLIEAFFACICGFFIKLSEYSLSKLKIGSFIINMVSGAIGTFTALLIGCFIKNISVDTIIISSIMLLVPGIAITNAIRDSIAGDLISGLTRALEAFLIAISIALGTGAILSLWIALQGGF